MAIEPRGGGVVTGFNVIAGPILRLQIIEAVHDVAADGLVGEEGVEVPRLVEPGLRDDVCSGAVVIYENAAGGATGHVGQVSLGGVCGMSASLRNDRP